MALDVSIRKGNRAATVVIVSGSVPYDVLRGGVSHNYDKKSVVNGIATFVYENEGRGRAGVVDGGEPVRIVVLGQRSAVVISAIHPLVHGNRTNERITGAIDVNCEGVSGA